MALVTVIMSVYNTELYLLEAIQSILTQTIRDLKFVIVNDGSTDGSASILDTLRDDRVTILHRPNRGLGSALNEALSLVDTAFVARMDSDDIAVPTRLQQQLDFMREHPEVGVLGTQIRYMPVDGQTVPGPPLPSGHDDIDSDLIRGRHALTHASLAFRKDSLDRVGGYRIGGGGQDLDLFLRLAEITRLANLPSVGLLVRLRPTSTTARSQRELQAKYSYAVHCATLRRAGRPEPPIEEFLAAWQVRGRMHDLRVRADAYSLYLYRCSITATARGNYLRAQALVFIAALCSPPRTYQRLCRWVRGRTH